MSDRPVAILARDLVKTFDGGLVRALTGVSLEIPCGEFVAVVGPSGSGKTTLLHLLGALDLPTSGTVEIMGKDIRRVADLDRLRSETLGFVFQLHHLVPNLPLRENVALPLVPRGFSRRERLEKADAILGRVGLGHRADFLPVKVSGGERQRAAIARALVGDPEVLLADEPTGSVDSRTGSGILDLFLEARREKGLTIVLITHNEAVAEVADRVVEVQDGKVAACRPGARAGSRDTSIGRAGSR